MATLNKSLHELDKARNDILQTFTISITEVVVEYEAEMAVSSIIDQLNILVNSLEHAKFSLEKAYNKLTALNQVLCKFTLWLEETESKMGSVIPEEVTLKSFEKIVEFYRVSNNFIHCYYRITFTCMMCTIGH